MKKGTIMLENQNRMTVLKTEVEHNYLTRQNNNEASPVLSWMKDVRLLDLRHKILIAEVNKQILYKRCVMMCLLHIM